MFSVLFVIVSVPVTFLFVPVLPENSPVLNVMFPSPVPEAVPELLIVLWVRLKPCTLLDPLIPLCAVLWILTEVRDMFWALESVMPLLVVF